MPSNFVPFFAASAGVSGALIGLLFVAMSVVPTLPKSESLTTINTRAALALHAFVNTLIVSLYALVPNDQLSGPVIWVSIISLIVLVMLGIVVVVDKENTSKFGSGMMMVLSSIPLFFELNGGFELSANQHSSVAISQICNALIIVFLIGVLRSWRLISQGKSKPHVLLWSKFRGAPDETPPTQ